MKAYGGRRRIAPLILNLGIRPGREVNCVPAAFPQERTPAFIKHEAGLVLGPV